MQKNGDRVLVFLGLWGCVFALCLIHAAKGAPQSASVAGLTGLPGIAFSTQSAAFRHPLPQQKEGLHPALPPQSMLTWVRP